MSGPRIFFERDAAGLSNVRLQLESLLVLAALTGRALVLPPPSRIQHLAEPFHESQFWSMIHLCRHATVILQSQPDGAAGADSLRRSLADVSFSAQGEPSPDSGLGRGDWFFPMQLSRIQHFECLRLATAEQRRLAAAVVKESFELDGRFRASARRALQHLGLAPSSYVAVHIRRGDFAQFRPQTQTSGHSLAVTSQGLCRAGGLPLVVATDAGPEDPVFRQFAAACSVPALLTADAHEEHVDDVTRAAVDLLLCAWAKSFVGTPDSTFSTTIMGLRTKAGLDDKAVDAEPRFLLGGKPDLAQSSGVCWSKPTTFAALRPGAADAREESPSGPAVGWLL